ncbi:MAG: G5 domain-containing protein [Tissierellia bacterium]|nr:G5 domain-containing protein [Tissierellia bacterium]
MENNNIKKSLIAGLSIMALSVAVSTVSVAQQPKNVELSIDNENLKIETSAKSVAQVLEDIGYNFIEGSKINYDMDHKIENDMVIDINTKKNISLTNGGHQVNVTTFADTVGDLLKEENIELDEDDIVSPSKDANLKNVEAVTVDYYKEERFTKKEKIKFKLESTPTMDLNYGQEKITTKGINGEQIVTFAKTFKNGKLLDTSRVGEEVTKKPVTQKVLVGQKVIDDQIIKNETITRNNSSMYEGQSKVIQAGQTGIIRSIYKQDGEKKTLVSKEKVRDPKTRIVEVGSKKRPVVANTSGSANLYSLRDLTYHGVINWGGYKYTYYSQSVLPGYGLRIPGRHVNASGFVADGDGYIVLANSRPKGTILPTPFGYMGKVYDRGTYGNHIDVYTR